jgi:hypothetical protein
MTLEAISQARSKSPDISSLMTASWNEQLVSAKALVSDPLIEPIAVTTPRLARKARREYGMQQYSRYFDFPI